ncbi:hypothetical protein SAMN02799631_06169 [Methylobacterium sp. 174MFSha1.1]|uniref:hypothetical protein n=1 Tax=Methylobacterium sp. 174MFSha1.1 TaxID=1502749 RepID=UPI0008EA1B5B|nr:hypothetical protein [Methylobacterium sp. 174MFSha1.1]SFV15624.1 hypothetical protein SAMN02799631_06169 [Methylobacterium sp. 174MFSha1.1]
MTPHQGERLREDAEARGQAALEQALTLAFWDALERGPLPPMAALEAAARTVGTLYRQIASLHGPTPRCGCGWQPEPDEDLIRLEAMLAAALIERSRPSLADLPVQGRA